MHYVLRKKNFEIFHFNFDLIKKELLHSKYNTKLIKHEILAVFYTDTNILKNVLERSFIFKQTLKTKNMNIHSI